MSTKKNLHTSERCTCTQCSCKHCVPGLPCPNCDDEVSEAEGVVQSLAGLNKSKLAKEVIEEEEGA